MSLLTQAVTDYLKLRRSLGYKLEKESSLLPDFVAFVEKSGGPSITQSVALTWATRPENTSPRWWSQRLGIIRRFSEYVRTFDPKTEIVTESLPHRTTRPIPHLYTSEEIEALMSATSAIRGSLGPSTYATLIGLLATTGMRISEAISLHRSDFDPTEGRLLIRSAKFGKSREVILHPSTTSALRRYGRARNRHFPRPLCTNLLVSNTGKRLSKSSVHGVFVRLLNRAGISGQFGRRPRIHDLRHSFAVQTLLDWYRAGLDVEPRLPLLSTYVGHVHPVSTYWYLTAVPELLSFAAQRLEGVLGGLT